MLRILILYAALALIKGKDLIFTMDPEVATTAHFKCIREQYDEIGMWFWEQLLDTETSFLQNFNNAKNAGLKVHVGTTPCRNQSAQKMIDHVYKYFGKGQFESFWIQPGFTYSRSCAWNRHTAEDNCNYLRNVTQLLKKQQKMSGVVTIKQYWIEYFGSQTGCPQLSDELMVWVPFDTDGQPNFDSYTEAAQIGGWKKPYMKFYSYAYLCGRNYYVLYLE